MSQKFKKLGFQSIKTTRTKSFVNIDEYGVISFSGQLRRDLSIKSKESAVLYFNPDEGLLAIHIGTFDRKKNKDMEIISIKSDKTISAKTQLQNIEDEYPNYTLLPQEGSKITLEDVEIENVNEKPDPYSRMIIMTLKREKLPFRKNN